MTPMAIVMIAIGSTDVLFALDSIPAIFGLTTEPYLVFTANAFALMGLVQLYFLIGGLTDRLVYLAHGLAFILGFIGVKLIFHALHEYGVAWAPEIPIWLSLAVIAGTLTATTVASLAAARKPSDKGCASRWPRSARTSRTRPRHATAETRATRLAPESCSRISVKRSERGLRMAIGLTEEHEALAESVRGFAERNIPATAVRAVLDADAEARPGFWPALAEQGLLGLHLDEEHGGQGFGLLELSVVLEELGRAAAPGPFLPTVLASAVIDASSNAKLRAELLPALADGSKTAAVALDGALTGRRDGDSLVVSGTSGTVLGAALADVVVLPVADGDGEQWVAVDAADLTVTPVASLDRVRRVAAVGASDVAVAADRVVDGLTTGRVADLAAALFGAEAAGLAGWLVETAAEYAKVREQFGRPIGQFQGVKHKAARSLIALEQARAAAWDAARAMDEGTEEAGFAAAVSAVIALDAGVQTARDAIQILGGIGFTWEHDAHVYLRRALTLRSLLGPSKDWAAKVAAEALGEGRREVVLELDADAQRCASGSAPRSPSWPRSMTRTPWPSGWATRAGPSRTSRSRGAASPGRSSRSSSSRSCGPPRSRPRTWASARGWCRPSSGTRRTSRRSASCARRSRARSSGASCSPSRAPGPTSPPCR